MTTTTQSKHTPWIEFNETGNTLFAIPYGAYRKFDQILSKNSSSANGLKFTFPSFENHDVETKNIERLLKKAYETCFLFKVEGVKSWEKLFENEVTITIL